MHRFKITIWKSPGRFAWGRDICEESMSVYVNGMRITYDCTHDGGRERGSDCLAEKAVGSFFFLFLACGNAQFVE